MTRLEILEILTTIFGVVGAVSVFLQAHKIYKEKSAKSISLIMYLVMFVGAFIWLLYGLEIGSIPVIVMEIVGITAAALVLALCFMYGKNRIRE